MVVVLSVNWFLRLVRLASYHPSRRYLPSFISWWWIGAARVAQLTTSRVLSNDVAAHANGTKQLICSCLFAA